MTYLNGSLSSERPINKAVVYRSGIRPMFFIVMASDLHTISKVNKQFKYADDVILIKSEILDVDHAEEFSHICKWSLNNKMKINLQKTKEIVFHKPNPRCFLMPTPLNDIDQVQSAKLLELILNSNLKFNDHVKYLLG